MTDSVREKICNRMCAMASGITKANGYATDIGVNPYLARQVINENELPVLIIWPKGEESVRMHHFTRQTFTINVEAHHIAEIENFTTVANSMIADIRKMYETYDVTLNALIDGINYSASEVEYPETTSDVVSVNLTFQVTYNVGRGDPYTTI